MRDEARTTNDERSRTNDERRTTCCRRWLARLASEAPSRDAYFDSWLSHRRPVGVDPAMEDGRARALRRDRAERPSAGDGLLARTDPSRRLLLPPPRHRRDHVGELRWRMDCRHNRAVRLRNLPRTHLACWSKNAPAS